MLDQGLVAGARRLHSPYLAEQVGQDNVWQRAGEARELWREHRELLHCQGCLLPQEAARTGRRGPALPTLAAAQSIQPLPLGSMFIRTSPSTRSGKMSCSEQERRAQREGEMCPGQPPIRATAQALHGADVTLSWEQCETCGKTAQPL